MAGAGSDGHVHCQGGGGKCTGGSRFEAPKAQAVADRRMPASGGILHAILQHEPAVSVPARVQAMSKRCSPGCHANRCNPQPGSPEAVLRASARTASHAAISALNRSRVALTPSACRA